MGRTPSNPHSYHLVKETGGCNTTMEEAVLVRQIPRACSHVERAHGDLGLVQAEAP